MFITRSNQSNLVGLTTFNLIFHILNGMFISRNKQSNLVNLTTFNLIFHILNGSGYRVSFRPLLQTSLQNLNLNLNLNLNELERAQYQVTEHLTVLISVLTPAWKQRCAPYGVDKVYFFVVDNAESLLHPKTSVNGPTKLHFRSGNSHGIITSCKLQVTRNEIQITNYKLQITNYKLQITDYRLQITDYKLQVLVWYVYFKKQPEQFS